MFYRVAIACWIGWIAGSSASRSAAQAVVQTIPHTTPQTNSASTDQTTAASTDQTEPPLEDAAAVADARSLSRAFRSASRAATPSVVTILVYGQQPLLPPPTTEGQPPPELPDSRTLTGIGSGVVVGRDGRIMTNHHVVDRAQRVVVQFADDTRHEATEVRGDEASDVAVVRVDIDADGMRLPPPATIGDSDTLEIGDWVLAIGSPFRLEATVSAGIISAKNRRLGRIARSQLFQTDAAVNPGNSGGALVDLTGRVIGINTAIATRNGGYQGVGFAIPINQAVWIADELANHGQVRRAAIGITMAELNRRIAAMFDVEPEIGVLAYEVIDGSAAEVAGVQKLDIITHFAGVRVRRPAALREMIEQLPIGSTHPIEILRGGKALRLQITLATVEDPTLE